MNRNEAAKIPSMRIAPDSITEDCFWYSMAKAGHISAEHADKAIKRMATHGNDVPLYALDNAVTMLENYERYGTPCAAWCKD